MMHCRRTCGKAQGTVVRTKTVKMTFKREELLYDIRKNANVEGDVMQVTTEMDDTPTFEEPTADAEGTVAEPEGETPEGETSGTVDDEEEFTDETPEEKPTGDYVIRLLVPDEYSKTTVRLIVRYIHEYMVCRVLADWLSITNPPAAANWKAKQDEALEGMKEAVNFRTGRVRRTQTPF